MAKEPTPPTPAAASAAGPNWLLVGAGIVVLIGCAGIWLGVDGATEVVKTETKVGDKTTTTTEGDSKGILVAFIGLGSLLFLVGVLYDKITKVSLPGGFGIELAGAAEAVLDEEAKKQAGGDVEKQQQLRAYAQAILADQYWGKVARPPDEDLAAAVQRARALVG